jgi:GAF domain-containing protein
MHALSVGICAEMDAGRDAMDLQPVAETREAFDRLGAFDNGNMESSVMHMAHRVREIAPDCVAMSLSVVDGDLTFTVAVDRPGASLLDAVQYLDGGPCLKAVQGHELEATADLPLDEGVWQMFARSEALVGVSSTLSLPILGDDHVVGGINLYGATSTAFDGHHQELADACGAWAEGAVTNADLGFRSRVRAAATPGRLSDSKDVDLASGVVAEVSEVSIDEAARRIARAANQAGVSEAEFARFLLQAHLDDVNGAASAD